MAEPVSTTGVCAATTTAVAAGSTSGAAGAGNTACVGAGGAIGGTSLSAGSVVGAAEGTKTAGATATGTTIASAAPVAKQGATPATGASAGKVALQTIETSQEIASESIGTEVAADGLTGECHVCNLPGARIDSLKEKAAPKTNTPATTPERAKAATPQQVKPDNAPAGKDAREQVQPVDPTPANRGESERAQKPNDANDQVSSVQEQKAKRDPTTQPQQRGQSELPQRPGLESRRPKEQGPADPTDPHERERVYLEEQLARYYELTEREKRELETRLQVWSWRDKEKYPDETPVIGPHGHMGRDAYEKKKKRVEAEESFKAQMELGKAIAEGNPLSSAVGLKIYSETGDPIAAAEGAQAVAGVTGGFKGKGPQASAPRTSRGRTAPKRRSTTRRRTRRSTKKKPAAQKGKPKKTGAKKNKPVKNKRKLTARQKYYQAEVQRLADTLGDAKKYTTVAILRVQKNGKVEIWISTSKEKAPPQIEAAARRGYVVLRGTKSAPGNRDLPRGEKATHHHAEHDGVSVALSNGYKVLEVYPSRNACTSCSQFRELGYTIIDPP